MLCLVLLLCVIAILTFELYLAATNNFHSVVAGQLYRSSQMSRNALTVAIADYGIKTIVNLRGENGAIGWYRAETNVAAHFGVKHFDFGLSAGREVTDEQIEEILAVIRASPKPVLIHCQAGADRTGLVSALYLYNVEGQAADAAGRALSVRYGHFPYLFWRNTGAMDYSFWRYLGNHPNHVLLPPQPR